MRLRPSVRPGPLAERGFALLIVLWSLVFLSLLATRLIAAAHSDARIAANLRMAEMLRQSADGAVFEAAFRILDNSSRHWDADATWHEMTVHGVQLAVSIGNEADKVNLNTAPAPLLAALLRFCGAAPLQAQSLSAAIVAWRGERAGDRSASEQAGVSEIARYQAAGLPYIPPFAPFRSVGELRSVAGMDPGILAQLRPHVTVYSLYGPSRDTPDNVVRTAAAAVRNTGIPMPDDMASGSARVVAVTVHAKAGGGVFTRRAVLQLDPVSHNQPLSILSWKQGDGGASERHY